MEMTENEKKKDYLWKYQIALKKQRAIEEEIRELRLGRMVPSLIQDGMPHSSGSGDLSGFVAKLDELKSELIRQAQKCIDTRREIVGKIEEMQDETEKLLLRYRYIRGLKWEDIALKMDYSWKQVHRIHAKALKNFKMT